MPENILAIVVIVVLAVSSFWFLATTLMTIWRNSAARDRLAGGAPEEEPKESLPDSDFGSEECYRYCREHSYLQDEGTRPSCASVCGT